MHELEDLKNEFFFFSYDDSYYNSLAKKSNKVRRKIIIKDIQKSLFIGDLAWFSNFLNSLVIGKDKKECFKQLESIIDIVFAKNNLYLDEDILVSLLNVSPKFSVLFANIMGDTPFTKEDILNKVDNKYLAKVLYFYGLVKGLVKKENDEQFENNDYMVYEDLIKIYKKIAKLKEEKENLDTSLKEDIDKQINMYYAKIVEENMGLVRTIIGKKLNQINLLGAIDKEDLEQIGYLALFKAAQNFDYKQGVKFSTYATKIIWNSIRVNLSIAFKRVTKEFVNTQEKILQTKEDELIQSLGRMPLDAELAESLSWQVNKVRKYRLYSNLGFISINLETFINEHEISVEKQVLGDISLKIKQILPLLTTEQKLVLKLYCGYPINGIIYEDCIENIRAISKRFDQSHENVRQTLIRILCKIYKQQFFSDLTDGFDFTKISGGFWQYFEREDIDALIVCINELKESEKRLIYLMFGEDLDTHPKYFSLKEYHEISQIMEKLQYMLLYFKADDAGGRIDLFLESQEFKEQTLEEYLGISCEEVKEFLQSKALWHNLKIVELFTRAYEADLRGKCAYQNLSLVELELLKRYLRAFKKELEPNLTKERFKI